MKPNQAYHIQTREHSIEFDYVNHRSYYVRPADGYQVRKLLQARINLMGYGDQLEARFVGRRLLIIRKESIEH